MTSQANLRPTAAMARSSPIIASRACPEPAKIQQTIGPSAVDFAAEWAAAAIFFAQSRVSPLFHDGELHPRETASDHSQSFGRGMRDVDDAPGHERSAVIDPDSDRAPSGEVGDAHPRAERQRPVRGGQFALVELLSARGLRALPVIAGDS